MQKARGWWLWIIYDDVNQTFVRSYFITFFLSSDLVSIADQFSAKRGRLGGEGSDDSEMEVMWTHLRYSKDVH